MSQADLIEIAGIRTNEKVIGDGVPILMLHGWGANISLIQPLADRLVPLGYKVYMLDLPGFGESAEPPTAYTVFDYANYCIEYMNHHNLHQVHLFGHSFGGRLGLILASESSHRIKKMVLSNSAGILTSPSINIQLRLKAYQTIRNMLYRIGAKTLADTLRTAYNQRYGSTDYKQTSGTMRQTFVNVVNQDLLDYAYRVEVPTILIWGDQDNDTPLWQGKKLEKAIKDSALIIHEGAGHYAYLEFSEKTARIMHALFQSD